MKVEAEKPRYLAFVDWKARFAALKAEREAEKGIVPLPCPCTDPQMLNPEGGE
jgi:hypothetical protein